MQTIHGKTVSSGIAFGTVYLYHKKEINVRRERILNSQIEVKRFLDACTASSESIAALINHPSLSSGQTATDILSAHQMLLQDPCFIDPVINKINALHVNAEYAVFTTATELKTTFLDMDDPNISSKAEDIMDVSHRVLETLCGLSCSTLTLCQPSLVVSDDLTPTETMLLNPEFLSGIVLQNGSENSHTAILARSMGIPCLTEIENFSSWNNQPAIIDGITGLLIIDPDDTALSKYTQQVKQLEIERQLLNEWVDVETKTRSGHYVNLYANICAISELEQVLHYNAAGIGLFRSEFLFLDKDAPPSEDAQFQIYQKIAQTMKDHKTIIRTIDIGADKQVKYLNQPVEDNPALGLRAIRLCLSSPQLFTTQLRAIYRASTYGNLSVMFPMITSLKELRDIKQIISEVKNSLVLDKIPFQDIPVGIMIETPAAALISDLLAQEVDFFSIGTNDLAQYTLAVDRHNPALSSYYDPHHPAVLRMIQEVITNAHNADIEVGMCGELAGDPQMTEQFISWGIDALSVNPASILLLRKVICSLP